MKSHDMYAMALRSHDFTPVVAYGSAGTGKTYGAVERAVEWLRANKKSKVVVTRPNVSFAKTLGHLPGDEKDKMEPWVAPVRQNLENFATPGEILDWERKGRLVYKPLEHIQGLTFDNSFILLDEAQNCTFDQLKVFLTRTGKYSQVVISGDIAQTSPYFKGSGLGELIEMINRLGLNISTVQFDRDDILRSEQCKMFIYAFEDWENINGK